MKNLIRKILKENIKNIYGNEKDYYLITTTDEKYIVGYMYATEPRVSYSQGEFLVLIPPEFLDENLIINKFMYDLKTADNIIDSLKNNTWDLWELKNKEPLNKKIGYLPNSYEKVKNQKNIDVKLIKYSQGYIRDNNDFFD